MTKIDLTKPLKPKLLNSDGPVCLIITARLKPVGNLDRFQPAGFPEVGHVIYDAPRAGEGNRKQKVCIIDSPASMANHLETVCVAGAGSMDLHSDLTNLPYVVCQTDGEVDVVSTLTEGHRLASDYFLDATKKGRPFREILRDEFKIVEVKKDKTYFIPPAKWWDIYTTIFKYDPNSLIHGVMFAKEQIKISRLLTAHLEAFGAARVGRSGVKFDRLQKTTSGQPIFSVDEETAEEIRATFVLDLAMLRSYGRGEDKGLNAAQKQLLLDLAIWKIKQLLVRPFRYRTQCFLGCESIKIETEVGVLQVVPQPNSNGPSVDTSEEPASDLLTELPQLFSDIDIANSIKGCGFKSDQTTRVDYPSSQLYKAGKEEVSDGASGDDDSTDEVED